MYTQKCGNENVETNIVKTKMWNVKCQNKVWKQKQKPVENEAKVL